jgi:hypothetical protein
VSDLNRAIQGLLDAEVFGSVATVVEGPDTGHKAVIDGAGVILAGELPAVNVFG